MAESERLEFEDFISPEAEKRVLDFIAKVKSDLNALGAQTIKDLPKNDSKPRLTDLQKEIELQKKLEEATKGLTAIEKLQVQIGVAKAANRKKEREDIAASTSAYEKESKQLLNQKKVVKDLLASKKELTATDKELIKSTQELDKKLKEIDSTVGDNGRHVGAYKEALQDIQAEMGIFGGMLGRITRTLKALDEQNEHSTTKWQKFGNVVKAVGIGIVLTLVALAKEAFNVAQENAESLANAMEVLTAQTKATATATIMLNNVFAAATAAKEYTLILQHSRDVLREMSLALQKVTLDLQSQNEIASDATIGYNERIEAQMKAIELSKLEVAKKREIAGVELMLANQAIKSAEVAAGLGNANNELKDKQHEAQMNFNAALEAEGSLERQNAEKLRDINARKTIDEINLLLMKRQSAAAEKGILEEQLKDQRKQLEERRLINDQLLNVNKKTTAEELAIFKKGFGIKFNSNKLLMEQDAVALQQKILALKTEQGHGLGETGVAELSKIIKAAQENQIDNAKNIAALDDEEIKRQNKIFEIKMKILDIENQEALLSMQEAQLREENSVKNKLFANIMKLDIDKKYLLQETELKQNALIEEEKNAEIAANNTINDTQILNAEILQLQTKLEHDLHALNLDALTKAHKIAEERKQAIKQVAADEIKVVNQITEGVRQGLEKREELQQESDQRMIDFHTRMVDVQATLAASGKENTLAEEQAATAKAEEKKIQDAKKAAKVQETVAIIETFQKTLIAALESNKSFPIAFGEAAASSGLVSAAFSKLFTGFYEGTESLGEKDGMKLGSGKDNILIRAHKGERIIGVNDSAEIPSWMSNSDVVDASLAYANGLSYLPPAIFVDQKAQENNRMYQEFKNLRQSIENMPVPSSNLDGLGEWTEKIKQGMNERIIRHKKSSARPSLRIHG